MNDEDIQRLLENPDVRFVKDKQAAGNYLLALSSALLEGRELPLQSAMALGQALREAALLALDGKQKPAGDVLLKALGLKKGGGQRLLEQAMRNGVTNQTASESFSIGKNQLPDKRSALVDAERRDLERRLSHTVGTLLRAVDEAGPGASIHDVVARVRNGLQPQFRLVDSEDIAEHVREALREAEREGLIEMEASTVKRTF